MNDSSFKKIILLIEFEGTNFDFSDLTLCNSIISQYKTEQNSQLNKTVILNLSNLVVKFQKIQIFWSRSFKNTSNFFKMLKNKRNDPDINLFENKNNVI